ncbi:ExbD/TolR family protein [Planctomycetota bacterium]
MISKVKIEEIEMNMTPMIDVVFLLLIFFMCAAKFKTLESKLETRLPRDIGEEQSMPTPDVTPRRIELKVQNYTTEDGRTVVENIYIRLGETVIGSYLRPKFADDPRDLMVKRRAVFTDLQRRLEESELNSDPNVRQPTFIAPDLRIPTDDVIQALDAVIAAGIADLTFAGKVSDIEKLRKEDGIED